MGLRIQIKNLKNQGFNTDTTIVDKTANCKSISTKMLGWIRVIAILQCLQAYTQCMGKGVSKSIAERDVVLHKVKKKQNSWYVDTFINFFKKHLRGCWSPAFRILVMTLLLSC